MKKEVFRQMLEEIAPERECKMIAVFGKENMPQIAITVLPRGYQEVPAMNYELNSKVELKNFKNEIEKLEDDEIFVLGRAPECDYRIGLDEVIKCFKDDENSVENAKRFYVRNCRNISRLHCFIKKNQDGNFGLYDCSLAGTCVVL